MEKTCRGSCHCGAVRFECALDLAEASIAYEDGADDRRDLAPAEMRHL